MRLPPTPFYMYIYYIHICWTFSTRWHSLIVFVYFSATSDYIIALYQPCQQFGIIIKTHFMVPLYGHREAPVCGSFGMVWTVLWWQLLDAMREQSHQVGRAKYYINDRLPVHSTTEWDREHVYHKCTGGIKWENINECANPKTRQSIKDSVRRQGKENAALSLRLTSSCQSSLCDGNEDVGKQWHCHGPWRRGWWWPVAYVHVVCEDEGAINHCDLIT